METFAKQVLAQTSMLRAFARSLSGDIHRGQDLVQETILRALTNQDKFQMGTNIAAWLVTILRNQFFSEGRKRRREQEDPGEILAGQLSQEGNQESNIAWRELLEHLDELPVKQKKALIDVGYLGLSYEESAAKQNVSVGTIKSRVSRAREELAERLHVDIDKQTVGLYFRKRRRLAKEVETPVLLPPPSPVATTEVKFELDGVHLSLIQKVVLPNGVVASVFSVPW